MRNPVNPDSRTVETVYHCADGERRFSVRYTYGEDDGIAFLGGIRKGAELTAAQAEQITQALREFDHVSTFNPQCSESFDTIIADGRIGMQRMIAFIVWEEGRIQVSAPQPYSWPG